MEPQRDGPQRDSQSVVLCLSGGGLRATFLHLGVVRLLTEIGWLQRVSDVFSVSGGSILAAHVALHWNRYASADERVFREGARLQDLPARPAFHFLATSLTSGQLCSFDRTGWTAVSLGHHGPSFRTPAGDLPLARIVAAPSAFPRCSCPSAFARPA